MIIQLRNNINHQQKMTFFSMFPLLIGKLNQKQSPNCSYQITSKEKFRSTNKIKE
jgi:hypothetical protein